MALRPTCNWLPRSRLAILSPGKKVTDEINVFACALVRYEVPRFRHNRRLRSSNGAGEALGIFRRHDTIAVTPDDEGVGGDAVKTLGQPFVGNHQGYGAKNPSRRIPAPLFGAGSFARFS